MRFSLIALLLSASFIAHSQDLRIPYLVGDKYGLSDSNGTLKVEAAFDKIEFMDSNNHYFEYFNYNYDSTVSRAEQYDLTHSGVIWNDQILIRNEIYSSYIIYENEELIVGKRGGNTCMFFNLKGERLFYNPVKEADFNYKNEVRNLNGMDSNLTLISVFKKHPEWHASFSLAVYNKEQQKLTEWLIEGAYNFNYLGKIDPLAYHVRYTTLEGLQDRKLAYDAENRRFVLSELTEVEKNNSSDREEERHNYYPISNGQSISVGVPKPPQRVPNPTAAERMVEVTKFEQRRDGWYVNDEKTAPIEGATYINKNASRRQTEPVIYALNGKYGLLTGASTAIDAKYDSLFYVQAPYPESTTLGSLYLVGNHDEMNNSWKYGIINHLEEEILPIEFDCLLPFIPTLSWDYLEEHQGEPLNFFNVEPKKGELAFSRKTPKNAYFVDRRGMLGIKDGKVGVLTIDNKIVLPFEYDCLFYNQLGQIPLSRFENDFLIVGKNNKYGIAETFPFTENSIQNQFLFPYIPIGYYPNFGGTAGFKLFKLFTPDGNFVYANEKGKVYAEE